MSSKKAPNKWEFDVQKNRDDGNWKKVVELAEQLKARGTGNASNEALATFLSGEGKLELYLEEYPPTELNVSKAEVGLQDAKKLLRSVSGEEGTKSGVSMDANLLLAKLNFACGHYQIALKHLTDAGLEQLTEKPLPVRSLRVVAESFAIHALALEKVDVSTTKLTEAEREQKKWKSMEIAADLALLYLQEQDKAQGHSTWSLATSGSSSLLSSSAEQRLGVLLETCIHRLPQLHVQAGRLQEAINRYRYMLTAMETPGTQPLRLSWAKNLAQLLMRSSSQASYVPPTQTEPGRIGVVRHSEGAWKPKRYAGTTLFVPRDVNEEIILLLLMSEAMAARDAVLSQSPDFKDLRRHALNNALSVYDLLALTLSRHGQCTLLTDCLERALKFAFEEPHIWSQLALSLMASGRYNQSLLVLKEASRLSPKSAALCLSAARLCYEHLGQVEEGLAWSLKAYDIEKNGALSRRMLRSALYVGLGYFLQSRAARVKQKKKQHVENALRFFNEAKAQDPRDHLPLFYLSLIHAHSRHISEATQYVTLALQHRADHLSSLLLLLLLLSTEQCNWNAGQEVERTPYERALLLAEASLEEYPESFDLLYIKARLEEHVRGGEVALLTARDMLSLWKTVYEDQPQNDNAAQINGNTINNQLTIDSRVMNLSSYAMDVSDRDNGSLAAQSMAAARAEQCLSEVASSLSSSAQRPGPLGAWHLQLRLWLLTAEIYIRMGRWAEAQPCLTEASNVSPTSYHVSYVRGMYHEFRHEFQEAKSCYQNAIALAPYHVPSLQRLGLVDHYLGNHRLAEKTLRDAIRLDPMNEQSWYTLGTILEALEEYEGACECMTTALHVNASTPILPFSCVPLAFD